VGLDHHPRSQQPTPPREPEPILPRADTTAPGDPGTVPEDIRVAMPRDYHDPWNPKFADDQSEAEPAPPKAEISSK
jgi:hypothetical protein